MKLMIWFSVSEKAIVYGCTLDAYCCVQTLIAMGIPGENIQLVEPPSIYQVSRFLMVNIIRILWTYPVAIKVLLKSFIYTCVRYDDFKNVSYQNKWFSSVFYQYIFYSSQPVSMTPKLMMLWNRPWFPVESRCILGTFWPIGMMGMMFQRWHLSVLHLARHHWLWNVG